MARSALAHVATGLLSVHQRVGVRDHHPVVVGVVQLFRALRQPAAEFHTAKRTAIIALTLSMLMWLVAFLAVGAEWFLIWQSHNWNGQEAAFRMFTVVGIVLLLLVQPETASQP